VKADVENANAQIAALKPRLQIVEARLLAIEQGTISLEALFAENPGILRKRSYGTYLCSFYMLPPPPFFLK
jgi:hypothetical protein